jgi:hypothetical protein
MKATDKSVYKDFEELKQNAAIKRVRKTEKEEDEEMLVEGNEDDDGVFSFSESPDCKRRANPKGIDTVSLKLERY